MDAGSNGRVSPPARGTLDAQVARLKQLMLRATRRPRRYGRRAAALAKHLRSFFRLSCWNFPEKEGKVPLRCAWKSCSLVGPKIPFSVIRGCFPAQDLGVTH